MAQHRDSTWPMSYSQLEGSPRPTATARSRFTPWRASISICSPASWSSCLGRRARASRRFSTSSADSTTPRSGTVRFRNDDLTALDDSGLTAYRRDHVGFVFQFYNLIPSLTARENVDLVTEIARRSDAGRDGARTWSASAARMDHFPAQMSGGEQQRVAIARAIAKQPDVLLCDEPTGALDSKTGVRVLEALSQVNQELGTTTALITHNAAIKDMAHRVLLFGDGRITGTQVNDDAQAALRDQLVVAMRMLDRKLLRDLRRMWAQALAIALVMASGVATFVLASGAYHSLDETRAAYYLRYRFADVFAEVRRAPKSVVDAVAGHSRRRRRRAAHHAPGAARCRRAGRAGHRLAPSPFRILPSPGSTSCICGEGRLPERERTDEVTINEGFAKAHRMHVGSTFKALLNGKKRELKVVGIALSPEFIYALGPGDLMPDDRRFAILWMSEKALAALFDLDGAFNSVSLSCFPAHPSPKSSSSSTICWRAMAAQGRRARKDQLSHAFLDAELRQLDALRRVMPPIFLLVSAFLINITLSRMIALGREQIGLLKALGYGRCRSLPTTSRSSWPSRCVGICHRVRRRRLDGQRSDAPLRRFLPLSRS